MGFQELLDDARQRDAMRMLADPDIDARRRGAGLSGTAIVHPRVPTLGRHDAGSGARCLAAARLSDEAGR